MMRRWVGGGEGKGGGEEGGGGGGGVGGGDDEGGGGGRFLPLYFNYFTKLASLVVIWYRVTWFRPSIFQKKKKKKRNSCYHYSLSIGLQK